jgi:hypothetical protein
VVLGDAKYCQAVPEKRQKKARFMRAWVDSSLVAVERQIIPIQW